MLILAPVRWLILLGVAACGYFIITSNDMTTRAFAFTLLIVLGWAYYLAMAWEADRARSSSGKKTILPKQNAEGKKS